VAEFKKAQRQALAEMVVEQTEVTIQQLLVLEPQTVVAEVVAEAF
jgi:hypothetical protein